MLLVVGAVLAVFQSRAIAYFSTVEGFRIEYAGGSSYAFADDAVFWAQDIRVHNGNTNAVASVSLLWQFVFSGNAFSYNNELHRWERDLGEMYGLHWIEGYTYDPLNDPGGRNSYFSMSRDETTGSDAPLTHAFSSSKMGELQATDEIPVYTLGDLAAGETTEFTLYLKQNSSTYTGGGWAFAPVLNLVSEVTPVPVPTSILLVGSGLGGLAFMRRNRSRRIIEKRKRVEFV